MNSIGRSSRPDGRSRLKSSPGLSPAFGTERRSPSKSELLSVFQEAEHDFSQDYDLVEADDVDDSDDQFKTLKISAQDLETLRTSPKKSIKFDDQMPRLVTKARSRLNQPKTEFAGISPSNSQSTGSSANVPTHKTLSDYSEDDTEVTSQFYDKDFEDLDNIFGSEEGDIYNKITSHLKTKKQQMQRNAELEEMELNDKFRHMTVGQTKSHINTLKIKDFNNTKMATDIGSLDDFDNLENENTINYEYTRDEFENFEDGFENFNDLNDKKIKRIYQAPRTISFKSSMPNFAKSTNSHQHQSNKMRKFKSSMDLQRMMEDDVHPVFNNNNRIMKKLERIPSFYHKDQELRKQSLLDKYKENIPLKPSRKKSQLSQVNDKTSKGRKIGLVRYLNDEPVANASNRMKYDAINRRWEGNDIELMKFESMHKPALITKKDLNINPNNIEPQNNMIYDNENLRWINLDDDNESLFNDIPDLEDGSKLKSPARGISMYTQRTTSTNSTSKDSAKGMDDHDTFDIPMKMINKFLKEESKIIKKTKNWFGSNEVYNINDNDAFNNDYFWEIRKMVIDNEH